MNFMTRGKPKTSAIAARERAERRDNLDYNPEDYIPWQALDFLSPWATPEPPESGSAEPEVEPLALHPSALRGLKWALEAQMIPAPYVRSLHPLWPRLKASWAKIGLHEP
jgi:hypothetical protein